MKTDIFDESSNFQKGIISILYRIILVSFSVFILLLKGNKYEWWYTIGFIVLYFSVFSFLFGKNGWYSKFRLLLDYILIGLTIYNVGIIDFYTISLLFLPILNSQNHTGNKKSIFLYILPLLIICIFIEEIEYYIFIPFFFFFFINSFEKFKDKYQRFYNDLNSALDSFLIEENSLNRLNKIYDVIIPLFNKYQFFSKDIDNIICFQIENETLSVINGTRFIFNFEFDNKIDIIKNSKQLIYNSKIKLNSEDVNENVILKIEKNSINYLFLILAKKNKSLNFTDYTFYYNLLLPFFSRLSFVLNFKRIQETENRKNLYSITKKVTYVNNAINSMHFTRNKLSPLKTYLSMMDDYNRENSIKRKKMIEPFLKIERSKLRTSLEQILTRADSILEKSNNPFNVLEGMEFSFFSLLTMIRDSVSYHLKGELFKFQLEENTKIAFIEKIKINETGIELILSNWFSNVNKYKSQDYYGVIIGEDGDNYYLKFYNKFFIKNLREVPDFVVDFNSSDRMAILKRKTHGLIEIKDFLEQMGIEGGLYTEEDVLYFKIILKKLKT